MSRLKILLFFPLCFILMGCPPGHFYEYKFIGEKIEDDNLWYTRTKFDDKIELLVRGGYYNQFIEDKKTGLAMIIGIESKESIKDNFITSVSSSMFGEFIRKDSLPYIARVWHLNEKILYDLTLDNKNERKMLKKIKNDTITIEFHNNKKLLFIKQ